jgi:SAM-dependent methyltransferase
VNCIVCDAACHAHPAIVSGFIAELVFARGPEATTLQECPNCGLRFFERRYSEEEMNLLYGGYRGERYFEVRHRHEPWYTRRLNDMTTASDNVIRVRKEQLAAHMRQHCPDARSVLDYGGDRGQFIPDDIAEKYLFDLAPFDPVEGVTKLSADEYKRCRFDCVIAANVIEHVSDPRAEIRMLAGLLNPGGTLIVSVPEEYPRILPGYDAVARMLRPLALRLRPFGMAIDLFSKVMKFKLNLLPPLGLISQSEHLNFFTPQSLALAAESASARLLATEYVAEPDGVFPRSLVAIARVAAKAEPAKATPPAFVAAK